MAATQVLLKNASSCTLMAGDLKAVFLPGRGMLGASLRHKGMEILRRVENLESAAEKGSTAGIPLLYPWANRLNGFSYHAAGRDVTLDPSSPLLHFDANGLPMHGVPWSLLAWELLEAKRDFLVARLDWSRSDLLATFPFPHQLELAALLHPNSLTLEATMIAGADGPVPVSFGFHPYFGFANLPRAEWTLELPPMKRLKLNSHGIPTGEEEPFHGFDAQLGGKEFDDSFALMAEQASFSVSGAGRQVTVEFLAGYRYVQIFAPKESDYIALEPMTAPPGALTSGRDLRVIDAGGQFRAMFRIRVEAMS
jgi:aldose 1-epimerase